MHVVPDESASLPSIVSIGMVTAGDGETMQYHPPREGPMEGGATTIQKEIISRMDDPSMGNMTGSVNQVLRLCACAATGAALQGRSI